MHDRATFDDTPEERRAFFERMWSSPGFSKLTSNYTDLLMDEAATPSGARSSPRRCAALVDDPDGGRRLIPKGHRYGEHRPPFVTDYYETYNQPNV